MKSAAQVFKDFLEERNLRYTRQRQVILERVMGANEHFSVQHLLDWASTLEHPIGKVTIYRTLALLVECNLVEERDFRQGRTYYERVYGHGHHEHLICLECGSVQEVRSRSIERLKRVLSENSGFAAEFHDLRIFGYCPRCAGSREKKRQGETVS